MSADLFSTTPIVLFPISDIRISPDRQREKASADENLVTSITNQGLINPIIIQDDGTLVAGERRLDAYRQLSRTHIPARKFSALTPLAAHLVELQENLARKSLSWQEETRALAAYHDLRLADYPAWTQLGTAIDLGLSEGHVSLVVTVAANLTDPDVLGASTLRGAYNLLVARRDRILAAASARGLLTAEAMSAVLPSISPNASREDKTAHVLDSLGDEFDAVSANASATIDKFAAADLARVALSAATVIERERSADERILHASFLDWAETYTGPKFDVAHCDFPYGKNYTGSNTRKTGKATTTPLYADSADIYFALVDSFLTNQDSFLLPSAHIIHWFDMQHYTWTVEQYVAAGWTLVQPFPLIWTKNYQGVASDPLRRPRHCYETALLFSRGDRRIRKLDQDYFEERTDEKLHTSQKPLAMLRHFLQLVVDEYSAVIDPTCGSGSALAAAGMLGASRLLGIELEESNVDIARHILGRELPSSSTSPGAT